MMYCRGKYKIYGSFKVENKVGFEFLSKVSRNFEDATIYLLYIIIS